MIFVLLAGLMLELIYSYRVFGKDLFSPSAILCEVFILSTIACIFNIDKWGVDLCGETVAVILGGNFIFILVSTIIHRLYRKKRKNIKKKKEDLKYININAVVLMLTIIGYLVFSVLFIKANMSALGEFNQGEGLSQAMASYRYETIQEGSSLSSWLVAANTFFNIGVYILIYIFVNNIIVNRKNKNNYFLLLPVALYLFSSIFTTERSTILLVFIYTLFIVYSLLNRKYQFMEKVNKKYIFRGILAVIIFLALFGGMRALFGRNDNRSIFDHITYYAGNSIESLDLFIKHPLESKQFGEETFRNFRRHLSKYGIVEKTLMETPYLEFRRDANGNMAGNVYTAYRCYIYDFGYASIIPFQILLAIFYGIWYEKLSCRKLKRGIDLSYILFTWFIVILFRFSIINSFFDRLAGFIFAYYWIMFLLWKILFSLKILKRNGNDVSLEKNNKKGTSNAYDG